MPSDDFKVETKPSLWWVQLSQGSYSDYVEQDHFIRANDKDEAWYQFKKWWTQEHKTKEGNLRYYGAAIDFEGEEFLPFGKPDKRSRYYGEHWDAKIAQLPVIECREFRRDHAN